MSVASLQLCSDKSACWPLLVAPDPAALDAQTPARPGPHSPTCPCEALIAEQDPCRPPACMQIPTNINIMLYGESGLGKTVSPPATAAGTHPAHTHTSQPHEWHIPNASCSQDSLLIDTHGLASSPHCALSSPAHELASSLACCQTCAACGLFPALNPADLHQEPHRQLGGREGGLRKYVWCCRHPHRKT